MVYNNPVETIEKTSLTLNLKASAGLLPVVLQFVEQSALVFAMGRRETLRLVLATEEVFVYLSREVCPGETLEVECRNGLYCTTVTFQFPASELNLRGLNIAQPLGTDLDSLSADVGLVIASRSVDRLTITSERGGRVQLMMRAEKEYETADAPLVPLTEEAGTKVITEGEPETLKLFASMAVGLSRGLIVPPFLHYPGKVVDMVASGEYRALLALDRRQVPRGGILFLPVNEKTVLVYGPYTFRPEEEKEVGSQLLEACIAAVARTRAVGIISVAGLPEWADAYFETLGTVHHREEKGAYRVITFAYRHLHEDAGLVVWSHPDLVTFLEEQHRRLFLAREIRTTRHLGEQRGGASILSAELRRERREAVLRPLWLGEDMAQNVERHVRLLESEGFLNLYFEIDLGVPWQAEVVPAVMEAGFQPRLTLPCAGASDLVLFQHDPTGT